MSTKLLAQFSIRVLRQKSRIFGSVRPLIATHACMYASMHACMHALYAGQISRRMGKSAKICKKRSVDRPHLRNISLSCALTEKDPKFPEIWYGASALLCSTLSPPPPIFQPGQKTCIYFNTSSFTQSPEWDTYVPIVDTYSMHAASGLDMP